MKYRPEIDGLRAIAVLPVIFFHAGFSFLSGGYVGVDVFYVISGYLITTIILNEMEHGEFTIANFYERRVRRILPALVFVIVVCLPFANFLMSPSQLKEFSQSLITVSLFGSNIFFWLRTGYFQSAADLKPFLHTWSLAVEEQYYLFFPLFIIFTWRFGKRVILVLLSVLSLLSLLLAQWGSINYPDPTFYLMPTRLWEILIGSFVAFYLLNKNEVEATRKHLNLFWYQVLGILGLSLILYAVFFFDNKTPFPSFYTLVPTIGTALIILFTSKETIVGRFLGNKLFVGIGLISYSAYLWHQPIFAFTRIRSLKEPNNGLMFMLGILALILAYLTWKYVENPFRDKRRFNRSKIFRFAIVSSVLIISIGVIIPGGFESRLAPNGMSYASLDMATQFNYGLDQDCSYGVYLTSEKCRTSNDPEILIWGDSFAMHLIPGILAANSDAKIVQMTKGSCAPFIGMAAMGKNQSQVDANDCIEFNNNVISWLKNNTTIKYAVFGLSLTGYLDETSNVLINNEILHANKTIALTRFKETLSMLSDIGIAPVVFAPLPTNGNDIGNCLVKDALSGGETIGCRIATSDYWEYQKEVLWFFKEVEKDYPVIWMSDMLCNATYCNTELDGVFIYRDYVHLSIEGSAYLGEKMDFYTLITRSREP